MSDRPIERKPPDRPSQPATAEALKRYAPILSWLPTYNRSWLTTDVVAGFTIWGLLIPEMIAYASLAGLPPQAGLYTLLASLVLYAIFGTSKQLVVAGTSASAVLVFSAVTALHPEDTPTYVGFGAGLILLTGVLFLIAGLFKLGFITQFLSRPVMEGLCLRACHLRDRQPTSQGFRCDEGLWRHDPAVLPPGVEPRERELGHVRGGRRGVGSPVRV